MTYPLHDILAVPDGAGKSTFYEFHLKALDLPLLNADVLARETRMDTSTAVESIAAVRDKMNQGGSNRSENKRTHSGVVTALPWVNPRECRNFALFVLSD